MFDKLFVSCTKCHERNNLRSGVSTEPGGSLMWTCPKCGQLHDVLRQITGISSFRGFSLVSEQREEKQL